MISNTIISVCMAAYNGEKYIYKQIDSILAELSDQDELIIVNDCSTDKTIEIIHEIQDPRIKLFNNDLNIGAIASFEKSICAASGNIIFLSDQDDIWIPGKVSKFKKVFETHPDVTLALSDAYIIDEHDKVTANSFFEIRGAFRPDPLSNIIKCKYQGCIIAFRKEMLDFFLPFPSDLPMHDIWIGVVNGVYGKTFFINEPLIKHRRHSKNTGRGMVNNAGLIQMILWRLSIIKNILLLIIKKIMVQGGKTWNK